MGENKVKVCARRRQSSRLQRQAPASIQINPVSDWNIAIPLLSPLVTSPEESRDWTAAAMAMATVKSSNPAADQDAKQPPAATVFKKWQHPAAPFCYEPVPPPHLLPAADNRSS